MPPVSQSPMLAVQAGVYARLAGDATLTDTLGAGVFDHVPEDTAHPFVTVGDALSTPDNVHGAYGREITQTVHVWTRARGNTPGRTIANRVVELLDHQAGALTVDGHDVVSIRHEFDQNLADPNIEIRHIVLRFRIVTSQQ